MSEENKKKSLEALFGESGLKYSFCRLCIGSSDFAIDEFCYVSENDYSLESFSIERDKKYVIPFLKDAIAYAKHELVLFASPWSPPAFMKDTNCRFAGGKLKKEYYDLYAQYLVKFLKAYLAEGIKISFITLQNEAKAKTTWESCQYTAEEEAELAKILHKHLQENNLNVKIMCWDHNKERLFERACNSYESAGECLDGAAFHWYSGDHYEAISLLKKQYPNKKVILSEFCRSLSSIDKTATAYTKEMLYTIKHGVQGICEWNLILNKEGGPYHNRIKHGGCDAPIRFDAKANKIKFSEIYNEAWMFAHFVKPGANALYTSTFDEGVQICAMQNLDGSIVVNLFNSTKVNYKSLHLRYNDNALEFALPSRAVLTILLSE